MRNGDKESISKICSQNPIGGHHTLCICVGNPWWDTHCSPVLVGRSGRLLAVACTKVSNSFLFSRSTPLVMLFIGSVWNLANLAGRHCNLLNVFLSSFLKILRIFAENSGHPKYWLSRNWFDLKGQRGSAFTNSKGEKQVATQDMQLQLPPIQMICWKMWRGSLLHQKITLIHFQLLI